MIKAVLFCVIVILYSCNRDRQGSFKVEKTENLVVSIQPIGSVESILTDSVAKKASSFFNVRTFVSPIIEMPKEFYINTKTPRYRADSIIRFLNRNKPDSVDYILGITKSDISTTKFNEDGSIKQPVSKYSDWGIFGLGFCPGNSCVVSTYRFGKSKSLRIERAQKVALHELGHNFGLRHCPNLKCFMQDGAETIKTIDKVQFNLCKICKQKLHTY